MQHRSVGSALFLAGILVLGPAWPSPHAAEVFTRPVTRAVGRGATQAAHLRETDSGGTRRGALQVAWVVSAPSASTVGMRGTVRFDPARLRYAGQTVDTTAVAVVNATRENEGILRIAVLNPRAQGPSQVVLAFDARPGADAATPLAFDVDQQVWAGSRDLHAQPVAGRTTRLAAVSGDRQPVHWTGN